MAIPLVNWRSKSVRLGGQSYVQSSPSSSDHHQQQYNDWNQKWMVFWRRFTRTKKKSPPSSSSSSSSSYDHQSYLQNFDQGIDKVEPEYLRRSFSAKYANPNSPFLRTTKDLIRIDESG